MAYTIIRIDEFVTAARREDFRLLRHSRDVIKTGPFKMWDAGPGVGCPVRDQFYRRIGLRVFKDHCSWFSTVHRYGKV
jgi:hypothetical protein